MAVETVVKTIGTTGDFSTVQLWEDGAPASLTTAERSNCGTFAVAEFQQGETLTFVGSGATGKFLDTDSTGPGTGTYVTYGITAGNPASSDVITGGTSGATAVLTSGTADFTGIIWEGQCQNQEFTSSGTVVTLTGSTASTTAYKHLTTIAGASFRDHADVLTNPLRVDSTKGATITCTGGGGTAVSMAENNNRISNLQIQATGSAGRALVASGTTSFVDNCIIEGRTVSTASTTGTVVTSGNTTFRNTVIIQRATSADHVVGTGTTSPAFYNCTIVAPLDLVTPVVSVFLSGASGTVTVQNCGLFAGRSDRAVSAGSATFNFTTCVSDIAGVAGVTQTNFAQEYASAGNAATDLRLAADSVQIDTGTTDATNASTDIKATARPQGAAYDIGAWESAFTVASKGTVSLARRMRRQRSHAGSMRRRMHRNDLLLREYY
jgi:hypothetical protein